MRRRARGRGSQSRGSRGGGSTCSRSSSSTSSSSITNGPSKTATILTTFQRQSSPYIRQLRGGLGRTSKSAINSVISDNDIMNNNTCTTEVIENGTCEPWKINGTNGITNGVSQTLDGYLHKKFKKVTSAEMMCEVSSNKNGLIPNHFTNHRHTGSTNETLISDEEKCNIAIPNLVTNGLTLPSGLNTTVYKPKFRLSSAKVEYDFTSQDQAQGQNQLFDEKEASTVTERRQHHNQMDFNKHAHRIRMDQLDSSTQVRTINQPQIAHLQSPTKSYSAEMLMNHVNEKRLDRKSLDDRISKIIHENQSILATWPEHLTKRTKGSGGRYSLSARAGTYSFGTAEPSRRESLDFVLSSRPDSSVTGLLSIGSNKSSSETRYPNFNRSRSDISSLLLYHEKLESTEAIGEDLSKHSSSSTSDAFMIPKKRRRLSPVPGILSGGEVSELPNTTTTVTQNSIPQQSKQFYPHQKPSQEAIVDQFTQTLRLSNNSSNSGAKVTIRSTTSVGSEIVEPIKPTPTLRGRVPSMQHDESSNSSSTSSNISYDSRQSLIRIRKDSIFEMDSSSSSSLASSQVVQINTNCESRKRGRPAKSRPDEISPRRKVVEKLKSHLTNSAAAAAAVAGGSREIQRSAQSMTMTHPLLLSIDASNSSHLLSNTQPQLPTIIITSPNNRNNNTSTKVPAASDAINNTNNSTTVNSNLTLLPELLLHEIPDKASLLLQTTALNPKRPTFLALKPENSFLTKKRIDQLSSILPSPETPRGAKNYNQMHINGNAYTYLGFKISTKPSYTCLFKPQPMFVPQETDPKLSMYSNWQPRPKDPNENSQLKLSSYDSRVNYRKNQEPMYIVSLGRNFDTLTVNSPENSSPRLSISSSRTSCSPTLSVPANILATQSPYEVQLSIQEETDETIETNSIVALDRVRNVSPIRRRPSPTSSPQLTIDEGCVEEETPVPEVVSVSEIPQTEVPLSTDSKPTTSDEGIIQALPRYRKKSTYFSPFAQPPEVTTSSSSESSSVDEFSNLASHRPANNHNLHAKGRSVSLCIDPIKTDLSIDLSKPLSLTIGGKQDRQRSQSVSLSSPSAILNNLDSARVKIMEGGFESNEDYTYVRGRGRGRYVCESCGIRCKKPSMLRKHLKTHTDLRPYTCKLCNFSFKTKGNLTKHQKSKSHHKKCIGLGIHPNSSRSLEMTGPISDSNTTDESDEDDDEDDENESDSNDDPDDDNLSTENYNDKEKFEKEIALSLLDLSQMSRLSDKRVERDRSISETNDSDDGPYSCRKMSTYSSPGALQSTNPKPIELEAPIDLSFKALKNFKTPNSAECSRKLFGGLVKSMEIVGEAQRWEPEEDFLRNGCLNLKKVRNHVDIEKEVVLKKSKVESMKPEVPELHSVQAPAPAQDKPFEFEITKKRRLSNNIIKTNGPVHTLEPSVLISRTPQQQPMSTSLVLSMASEPKYIISATVSTASVPKRLHQPWLSPQGLPDEAEILSVRERTESFTSVTTNGDTSSNCGSTTGVKEDEIIETLPEPTNQNLTPLPMSMGSGNGIKIPNLMNGNSPNLQAAFSGLIGMKPQAEFRQPSGAQLLDEGKAECNVCGKTFARAGQLTLHMNIHYLERPFRCDPCGVSFRTKGHLIKHRRSSSHDCKVYLTEAWGVANEENPRPFKCADCKIAFRIHGHLAKHLRSKMHIMRMECLGKLPFGIYFEMEKSGLNLNEIDTTDCDMSLVSLQSVAQKIYGDEWREKLSAPIEDPV